MTYDTLRSIGRTGCPGVPRAVSTSVYLYQLVACDAHVGPAVRCQVGRLPAPCEPTATNERPSTVGPSLRNTPSAVGTVLGAVSAVFKVVAAVESASYFVHIPLTGRVRLSGYRKFVWFHASVLSCLQSDRVTYGFVQQEAYN